jgi:predicted branched-subunit amino acid permease
MNQNSISEKPTKSVIWIIGTIWGNIIPIGLTVLLPIMFLQLMFPQLQLPIQLALAMPLLCYGAMMYAINPNYARAVGEKF